MNSTLGTLLLFVFAIVLGYAVFADARRLAEGSPTKRRVLLGCNLIVILLGLFLALWLPPLPSSRG